MSFAYAATPGGKESLQLFRMAVAMFSEEGKCRSSCIVSVVWYAFVIYIYHLVRVCRLVRVYNVYLQL